MPISVEHDLARQWLVVTAVGDISAAEILELLHTARAPIDLRMRPMLFDATGATTSIVQPDIDRFVDFVRAAAASSSRGHVALVADDDRFYNLLLSYETRCAALGVRVIRVFRFRPDAERWLKVMSAARNLQ
jgi:hypothetical protein